MRQPGLLDLVSTDPVLAQLREDAGRRLVTTLDIGAPPPVRPFVAAALSAEQPVLLVTSTYREAEDAAASLRSLLGDDAVAYFPSWETLPHERLSPRSDTVGARLEVLRRLTGRNERGVPRVTVAPVRSVLQPQVRGLAEMAPVAVAVGDEIDPEDLARGLVEAAYTRVDLVERRGQFAVRGGIVDVFSPTDDHPRRIDFFGDEVEEIREFSVADQRSGAETFRELIALPCRELLLTDAVRARAGALQQDHPELAEMLERISQGHAVDGMESLAPALVDGMELLTDVVAPETLVLLADPELIRGRASDLVATSEEFLQASWAGAAQGGRAPIDLAASAYRALEDVQVAALGRGLLWWSLSQFSLADQTGDRTGVEGRSVRAIEHEAFAGDSEAALATIRASVEEGRRVVVTSTATGLAQRMVEVVGEAELTATLLAPEEQPQPGVVSVAVADLGHGFSLDSIGLSLHTAADLVGQRTAVERSERRMPSRRKKQVDPLELTPGDPVVHEQHGVGRYVEMVTRTLAGSTREYLVVEYASSKRGQPGDRLYVPMDQLDQVTRYIGGENPTLDRMGGGDWTKRKSRARKAVREIASELIKLYAARQASRGHAFAADNHWQRELEDAFGFVETPDQLACIDDVKRDMERIVPMDRLVCGDVGYGKTEIAVRAAFKAVQDGKQVAVLVPTTLLVQQHANTFAGRYAGFPVTVASLSRFQTAKESEEVVRGVAEGRVDVVVGTHRLLSGQVRFKNLGLVIIDEEQRFGVEHKEALKRLRMDVDVLAMSATPIPRTLEMAITGIREMSTIATPPEERHPVLTFAGPYDEAQVTAAIRRELLREGQVFYIHNRVQSIDKVAKRISELVPDARVVTAHGQMGEHRLEQVMVDFWERRADVLVATTIVEAGLDINTANTLIIERSDQLGLSQLHQLRGRVGRGRERGYAYFLYPPDKPLTETAHDRLATMAAHTELGAGMKIAMKDLEIRGAGNLLGGEQSGHIADVGFDLYIRLVGEAVADFRGDSDGEPEPDVRIELPVEAHLPGTYIESERLRLEMYKRLAEVREEDDVAAVLRELVDRYGTPPPPVDALMQVARFRLRARAAGLREVVGQGASIRFAPFDVPESRRLRLQRLYPGAVVKAAANHVLVPRPKTAKVAGQPVQGADLLAWCDEVIEAIFTPTPSATASPTPAG